MKTPQPASGPSVIHRQQDAMGSTADLWLDLDSGAAIGGAAFGLFFDGIEEVEADLSTYRTSSEISRINRLAAKDAVATDPVTFELLRLCLDLSVRSGGAFDISVGRLVEAWGFRDGTGRWPDPETLARAQRQSGYRAVELDTVRRSIRFLEPLQLDLGAVGKGWALDRVMASLRDSGTERALGGLGNSAFLALGGPAGSAGWPIEYRPDDTRTRLALAHEALATSGSRQRSFVHGGVVYSHLIDPRSGLALERHRQVAVRSPSATRADALSTALAVLGPTESAVELLELNEGAIWFRLEGSRWKTESHRWSSVQ